MKKKWVKVISIFTVVMMGVNILAILVKASTLVDKSEIYVEKISDSYFVESYEYVDSIDGTKVKFQSHMVNGRLTRLIWIEDGVVINDQVLNGNM